MTRYVETSNGTTVMTRLLQAALLTLLLQLLAQMYPWSLPRTLSTQQRSTSDAVVTGKVSTLAIAHQWTRVRRADAQAR